MVSVDGSVAETACQSAPAAVAVPLPSFPNEPVTRGGSLRLSSASSSNGSLSPPPPTGAVIASPGRKASDASGALTGTPAAVAAVSNGSQRAVNRGMVGAAPVPRLTLLPPTIPSTICMGSARASHSVSPRGQGDVLSASQAHASRTTPPSAMAFPLTVPTTQTGLNSTRSTSPSAPSRAGRAMQTMLPGSASTPRQADARPPLQPVHQGVPFRSRSGRTSLTGSVGHSATGWTSVGTPRVNHGQPTHSVGTPRLNHGRTTVDPLGGSLGHGCSTSSPWRFPTGARSPSVPLQMASLGSATVPPKVCDFGEEENDKENAMSQPVHYFQNDKERKQGFAQNKVLGGIDNVLLFANSTSIQTSHALKSDFTSHAMPKAWAWDTKWHSDADLEEDEMHNQLWRREPADASRFKRVSVGKYLFDGQSEVQLKIVYGQLYLTSVDDGQVASMEDFLRAHPTCAGGNATPAACRSRTISSTAASPCLTNTRGSTATTQCITGTTVSAASTQSTSGSGEGSAASVPCPPSTACKAGAGAVSSEAGATENSSPPSPMPAANQQVEKPSCHLRRAEGRQRTSRGRATPLGTAWQISQRPRGQVTEKRPFSTRHVSPAR